MNPDDVMLEVQGMAITARDIACYMAIAGSMPIEVFNRITGGLTDMEELEAYIVAYDKAKLAYNEVLGEL